MRAPCPSGNAAFPRRGRLGLALVAATVIFCYGYLAALLRPFTFERQSPSYYALLADGFMAGRLSFLLEPPAALAKLADPYEPQQRVGIDTGRNLLDVTYYKGRYYIYFGVAPELVLFLPFRLLTGVHFSENLAVAVFCSGGYLCSLGLFLALRRKYFPAAGTGIVCLAAILLGGGNFALLVLERSHIWEVPISSAYVFSCLGLWLLFLGWERTRGRLLWLTAASTALGLAVASRPHFVVGAALLGAAWLWRERDIWRRRSRPDAAWWREAAALFLPLGVILAGIFAYNFLRFGNPFEFGVQYMLGSLNARTSAMASVRYVPINFYYNFLAPVHFSRYFPFFQGSSFYPFAIPKDYFGFEYPAGVLTTMPAFWLALAAPLVWFRRRAAAPCVGRWLLLLGLYFVGILWPVLGFISSANRYVVDYLPTALLVAVLGLLLLSQMAETSSGFRRTALRALLGGIVAYTVFFNLMEAVRYCDYFEQKRPATYAALARVFNRPAAWWEAASGQSYGPLELTVKLAPDRIGSVEPLLVAGTPEFSDYLFVHYLDGAHFEIGFSHSRGAPVLSQPIAVDYSLPHEIAIEAGFLLPPVTHPYFAGRPMTEVRAAKRRLRVSFDRVPYLDTQTDVYDASPRAVYVGENPLTDYSGRKFHGEILAQARRNPPEPISPFEGASFLRLALQLGAPEPARREPLIATGSAGQGDLLFLLHDDPTHVRLGLQHAGTEVRLSEAIAIQPQALQVLEASLGSFYSRPANARERELAQLLVVRLNGNTVWQETQEFHPATGGLPAIGRNPWADGRTAPTFSGKIVTQQPFHLFAATNDRPFRFAKYWQVADAATPRYGGLRLRVELPRNLAGHAEPFVVTGPSAGQADYVWIYYGEGARRALVGYEHTGGGGPKTPTQAIDFSRPHVVEIEMPSLYPERGDDFFADRTLGEIAAIKGRLALKFDGKSWLDAPVPSWASRADQITPGLSRVSKVYGERFSGKILSVERSGFAPPPGFADETGPVELSMLLPPDLASGQEVLLATSRDGRTDLLSLAYESGGRARLNVRTARGSSLQSAPLNLSPGGSTTLRISWGGFYPETLRPKNVDVAVWSDLQRRVRIELDGKTVLEGPADFLPSADGPLTVDLGGAAQGGLAAFSGQWQSLRRLPAEPRR